jgi:CBS domain-containing protein
MDATRRHHTAEDVMTTPVVTVRQLTPYQEIARLLAERQISGLPVLTEGGQVIGVVSETDLIGAETGAARQARARDRKHARLTAGELMTAPAVTVRPDTTIAAATEVMRAHHVGRLPVTGPGEMLIGIVSRRDLLSVFLRDDADVLREVARVLKDATLSDPANVLAAVRHGVVTLTGQVTLQAGQRGHLVPSVVRLVQDVDGVVDVVSWLTEAHRTRTA